MKCVVSCLPFWLVLCEACIFLWTSSLHWTCNVPGQPAHVFVYTLPLCSLVSPCARLLWHTVESSMMRCVHCSTVGSVWLTCLLRVYATVLLLLCVCVWVCTKYCGRVWQCVWLTSPTLSSYSVVRLYDLKYRSNYWTLQKCSWRNSLWITVF